MVSERCTSKEKPGEATPGFYVFDNTEFKGYNNKRDSLTGGTVGSSPWFKVIEKTAGRYSTLGRFSFQRFINNEIMKTMSDAKAIIKESDS